MRVKKMRFDISPITDSITEWTLRCRLFDIVLLSNVTVQHAPRREGFLTHIADKFARVEVNALMPGEG